MKAVVAAGAVMVLGTAAVAGAMITVDIMSNKAPAAAADRSRQSAVEDKEKAEEKRFHPLVDKAVSLAKDNPQDAKLSTSCVRS